MEVKSRGRVSTLLYGMVWFKETLWNTVDKNRIKVVWSKEEWRSEGSWEIKRKRKGIDEI